MNAAFCCINNIQHKVAQQKEASS